MTYDTSSLEYIWFIEWHQFLWTINFRSHLGKQITFLDLDTKTIDFWGLLKDMSLYLRDKLNLSATVFSLPACFLGGRVVLCTASVHYQVYLALCSVHWHCTAVQNVQKRSELWIVISKQAREREERAQECQGFKAETGQVIKHCCR